MAVTNVAPPREFLCPGEKIPVTRAVHLARLAAAYPACGRCPFREGSPDRPQGDSAATRLCRTEGFRGVYLNELGDDFAGRLGAALAALLWNESDGAAGSGRSERERPVVVAFDDRPWSARLAVLAGEALRRSGCATIDVGMATGPQFRHAVALLEAAAGVIATGAGGGPALAGFDLALAGGRPLSAGGTLERLFGQVESNVGRMTRIGGPCRSYDAAAAYHELLTHHLACEPAIPAIVGTASPLLRNLLSRFSGRGLRTIDLPRRAASEQGETDDLDRIAKLVRSDGTVFGFWIDEEGSRCRAVDETGTALSGAGLARLLLTDLLEANPASPVAVDWTLGERLAGNVLRRREVVRSNGTSEAMFLSVRDHAAVAGADSAGRFWLSQPTVGSDALLALGRLRRLLADGDEPLSQRVRSIGSAG